MEQNAVTSLNDLSERMLQMAAEESRQKDKRVLDIKQMSDLQRLGLDVSDGSLFMSSAPTSKIFYANIRTYDLQDILNKLPDTIDKPYGRYILTIEKMNGTWYVSYVHEQQPVCMEYECSKTLIDAAYEMMRWCIKNGYIKTNTGEDEKRDK